MRWSFFAAVAASVLQTCAQLQDDTYTEREPRYPRVRRRMGFRPELPRARFESQPSYASSALKNSNDPFAVATDYVHGVIKHVLPEVSFRIREDSYTDNITGITHVYVRPSVFTMEVANGDIQLAIKDGQILAVSNSVSPCTMPSTRGSG